MDALDEFIHNQKRRIGMDKQHLTKSLPEVSEWRTEQSRGEGEEEHANRSLQHQQHLSKSIKQPLLGEEPRANQHQGYRNKSLRPPVFEREPPANQHQEYRNQLVRPPAFEWEPPVNQHQKYQNNSDKHPASERKPPANCGTGFILGEDGDWAKQEQRHRQFNEDRKREYQVYLRAQEEKRAQLAWERRNQCRRQQEPNPIVTVEPNNEPEMVRIGEYSPNNFRQFEPLYEYGGDVFAGMGAYEEQKRLLCLQRQLEKQQQQQQLQQMQPQQQQQQQQPPVANRIDYDELLRRRKEQEDMYRAEADPTAMLNYHQPDMPKEQDWSQLQQSQQWGTQPAASQQSTQPAVSQQSTQQQMHYLQSMPGMFRLRPPVEYSATGIPLPRAPSLSVEEKCRRQEAYRFDLQTQMKEQEARKKKERELDMEVDVGAGPRAGLTILGTTRTEAPQVMAPQVMMEQPREKPANGTPGGVYTPSFIGDGGGRRAGATPQMGGLATATNQSPATTSRLPRFNVCLRAEELPDPRVEQERIHEELREQIEEKKRLEAKKREQEREEEEKIQARVQEEQEKLKAEYQAEQERRRRKEEEKQRTLDAVWSMQQHLQKQAVQRKQEEMQRKREQSGGIRKEELSLPAPPTGSRSPVGSPQQISIQNSPRLSEREVSCQNLSPRPNHPVVPPLALPPEPLTPRFYQTPQPTPRIIQTSQSTPHMIQTSQSTPRMIQTSQPTSQMIQSFQPTPQMTQSFQPTPQMMQSFQPTPQMTQTSQPTSQMTQPFQLTPVSIPHPPKQGSPPLPALQIASELGIPPPMAPTYVTPRPSPTINNQAPAPAPDPVPPPPPLAALTQISPPTNPAVLNKLGLMRHHLLLMEEQMRRSKDGVIMSPRAILHPNI